MLTFLGISLIGIVLVSILSNILDNWKKEYWIGVVILGYYSIKLLIAIL